MVDGLREKLDMPVVGAGETAAKTASHISKQFSIVTIWPTSMDFIYEDLLRTTNTREKCQQIVNLSDDDDLETLGNDENFVTDLRSCSVSAFSQLKAANTIDIVVKKSSYTQMNNNVFLACVDWEFIDGNGDVFADFCAYYHLLNVGETECKLKIINVNSHELSNSLPLALPFKING